MTVPAKTGWRVTASGGDPKFAADDRYATAWTSAVGKAPSLEIDLGGAAKLGGLEVYWGRQAPTAYRFEGSADEKVWSELCRTRHGEGGQDVFAFPPVAARFVRLVCEPFEREQSIEIVEVNLYGPAVAARVLEPGRLDALGRAPVTIQTGESITVDLGYVRSPLGALIAWGKSHGTVFSAHLSDDGRDFREVGRIATGDGGADSFWWRSTTARYLRLTVHEASAPEGAVVDELKLRILNKDRMPIGALERAAAAGRGELYPQSLLGRQVYWTALGEFDTAEQALFDEYADLEPERAGPQIAPLVRIGRRLHGVPVAKAVSQSLVEGALPIPSVAWSFGAIEVRATALAQDGQAIVGYS
ncbi:MAG: discoidin domain-containing protein, partial [Hyphomicrobiales bacterium]|nr:discoidin domain-containing protein [Hyphomicrobiales bacterium]